MSVQQRSAQVYRFYTDFSSDINLLTVPGGPRGGVRCSWIMVTDEGSGVLSVVDAEGTTVAITVPAGLVGVKLPIQASQINSATDITSAIVGWEQ